MRSKTNTLNVLCLVQALASVPAPGGAQGTGQSSDTLYMSLAEARTLALERSPAFLAEARRLGVAEGAVQDARAIRFNPEAEAEFPGTLNGTEPRGYEVRISQRVEWAGQRGLRVQAAQAGLESAGSGLAEFRRSLLRQVTEAFYSGVAAQRRLELAVEISSLNQRLSEAAEVQLEEGEISAMDGAFAEIEAGRSRARVSTARWEATSAALELARLVGLRAGSIALPVDDTLEVRLPEPGRLSVEHLVEEAVRRRPDLDSRIHDVRQREALTRLARRTAIPDVAVGALVSGGEAEPATRVGLQLSVGLPLWNRNGGVVAQREAEARRVALERDAVELSVRTEVLDAYQAYVAASEAETLMSERVLDPARRNQALLDTAYGEGEIDLPSLLLLRDQLLAAQIGYWDAWLDRRNWHARLQAAVGDFELDLEAL